VHGIHNGLIHWYILVCIMHIVLSSGIFISLPPSLPPPLSSLSVSHTRHTHTYIQSLFTHRRQATPEERTRLFPLALILFTHTHTHTHTGVHMARMRQRGSSAWHLPPTLSRLTLCEFTTRCNTLQQTTTDNLYPVNLRHAATYCNKLQHTVDTL